MKRKHFIYITAVVLAGVIVPLLVLRKKAGQFFKPLTYPESLIKLFDKKTIHEIGSTYRSKHFTESDVGSLKRLLLKDSTGKIYNEEEKIPVKEMLKKETKKDFEAGRIVVVKGWVLSLTEARQCALFSLTNT